MSEEEAILLPKRDDSGFDLPAQSRAEAPKPDQGKNSGGKSSLDAGAIKDALSR